MSVRNTRIIDITLDCSKPGSQAVISGIHQGEYGSTLLRIRLVNSSTPIGNITNAVATLYGTKADENIVANTCELSENGISTYTLSEQDVSCVGAVVWQLVISGDGGSITSPFFNMIVEPRSYNGDTIISSESYVALDDALASARTALSEAQTLCDQVSGAISTISSIVESVESKLDNSPGAVKESNIEDGAVTFMKLSGGMQRTINELVTGKMGYVENFSPINLKGLNNLNIAPGKAYCLLLQPTVFNPTADSTTPVIIIRHNSNLKLTAIAHDGIVYSSDNLTPEADVPQWGQFSEVITPASRAISSLLNKLLSTDILGSMFSAGIVCIDYDGEFYVDPQTPPSNLVAVLVPKTYPTVDISVYENYWQTLPGSGQKLRCIIINNSPEQVEIYSGEFPAVDNSYIYYTMMSQHYLSSLASRIAALEA